MKKAKQWKAIKIDAETYEKLKRLADKRSESFSTLISLILKKYV
jgi:predicted CopG family antitoxin